VKKSSREDAIHDRSATSVKWGRTPGALLVGRTPCGEQRGCGGAPPERRHGEDEPCCFRRVPPEPDATDSSAVPRRVVDPGDPWQRRGARSVLSVGGSGPASSKAQSRCVKRQLFSGEMSIAEN